MSKGYIYIIRNTINNNVYIGQTTKPIEERFRIHCKDSARSNDYACHNYHFYRAMRKYGCENFYIELLEECKTNKLDEREIYYIKKFDSFNNGYNSTLGGGGRRTLDLNEDRVVKMYNDCKSITQVSDKFDCCSTVVRNILRKYGTHIETNQEKGTTIIRCNSHGKHLEKYECTNDAARWLIKNEKELEGRPVKSISQNIINHLIMGAEYYGYFWKSPDYSKEEIIEKRQKLIEEWTNDTRIRTYYKKKNKCPYCGNEKEEQSLMCFKCHENIERLKALNHLNGIISRDELKDLIRTTQFRTIGNMYGVSDNAVRKWCKRYKLPFSAREISKISDKEWKTI